MGAPRAPALGPIIVALASLAGCYQSHALGEDAGRAAPGGPSCCEDALTAEQCARAEPDCVWLVPDGCGEPPPRAVDRPTCVPIATCSSDDECGTGTCVGYWIDPCRDDVCRACGGVVGHCSRECLFIP